MIQKDLREGDVPKRALATGRAAGGSSSETNKQYSSAPARAAAAAVAPSSQLWLGLRDPRIVRVSRALGGKDRHSKVSTVRGLRDRRVRLSVQTAIQLYDLQDRLGLSQPSKVVDWLLDAAQHEIDKLPPLHFPPHFPHHHVGNTDVGNSWGTLPHDHVLRRNSSTCSTTLSKEEDGRQRTDDAMEGRDGGRGVGPWNSTAVPYHQFGAAGDHILPSRSSPTVTAAAVQVMPGSYALQPAVPTHDPSYLYFNHRLAVAAATSPPQLSLLPVLGGTKPQTTSSAPTALLLRAPGAAIAMPQSLIQAHTTSVSAHDPKVQDHFHSLCTATAAAAGTSPLAAHQNYLPSTNSDSFPPAAPAVAAAPSSIGRLLS